MYKEHFGLKDAPFSIAPDPRYLYMSEQHREALAHLVYGFNSDGGFVLLTGEIGTGKTTVCRCLLEQVPDNSIIAFIFNPKLTVDELLATVCDEFGIVYPENNKSIKVFVDLINTFLLNAHGAGRKAVLIIDEAQNLSSDVLEQLRLLTNLETSQKKLLQIILLGQPELRDKLSKPELLQLSQRIIARYHLGSLSKDDMKAYIVHRLSVAGVHNTLFSDSALGTLYAITAGVPRLINIVCDRALLGAFVNEKTKISSSIVKKAAREVFGTDQSAGKFRKAAAWTPLVMVFIVFGAVLATSYYKSGKPASLFNPPAVEISAEPVTTPQTDEAADAWNDTMSIDTLKDKSYEALFSEWNIAYNPEIDGPACSYAETKGLQCLRVRDSFDKLLQLNRPALLKLYDNAGQEYFGTVTEVAGKNAALTIGSVRRSIPLGNIVSQWAGEYTLLWKPPAGFQQNIKTGYTGAVVRWLDTQLSKIHDRALSPEGSSIYSDALAAEIRRFQRAEGLKSDGIVGSMTIIRINTLNDQQVPLLVKQYAEGK
jgi:general secretion pathway protein A